MIIAVLWLIYHRCEAFHDISAISAQRRASNDNSRPLAIISFAEAFVLQLFIIFFGSFSGISPGFSAMSGHFWLLQENWPAGHGFSESFLDL
jgi:hypothetical protein